jgi:hypothetical protein
MTASKGSGDRSATTARPSDELDSTVKAAFTCGRCAHDRSEHGPRCQADGCTCHAWRRSRPTHRDRETLDYLSAARRFIRVAGRRVGECDEHELAALIALQVDLDAAIQDAVDGQKAHGKSWAMIGVGAGTTREAAFQRWGKAKR